MTKKIDLFEFYMHVILLACSLPDHVVCPILWGRGVVLMRTGAADAFCHTRHPLSQNVTQKLQSPAEGVL